MASVPTIQEKAPKPPGLLPKNVQSWLLVSLAVLMVLIMWLTGGKKPATPSRSVPLAPAVEAPLDEFWRAIKLDLFGTFLGCRFGIPELVKAGGGSVINMSSNVALMGVPGRDCYTAAGDDFPFEVIADPPDIRRSR